MPRPCPAPLPLTPATFVPGVPDTVVVTFDQPLVPAVLAVANWFVRFNNQTYIITAAATPPGSTVILTLGLPGADVGPNRVIFTPPPFDLLADCGTPVAAFNIGLV